MRARSEAGGPLPRLSRLAAIATIALGSVGMVAAATPAAAIPGPAAAAMRSDVARTIVLPAPRVEWYEGVVELEPLIVANVWIDLTASGLDELEWDDVFWEMEVDGSGIWVPDLAATGPMTAPRIGYPDVTVGLHTARARAVVVVDGVRYVSPASPPVVQDVRAKPLVVNPTAVVDGSSVTFSWDVRSSLQGWPESGGVQWFVSGAEGYVQAAAADSVTLEVGYDTTVEFSIVYGGPVDYASYGGVTVTTGPAPTRSFSSTPPSSIVGIAAVGNTLTARSGTWQPAPVALGHQWLRNGVPIVGATAARYTVVASDAGARISVAVTGSKSGYASATKVSAPTVRVPSPVLTSRVPSIVGITSAGNTLTAYPGIWGPAPVALGYQWSRNGVAIPGATASTYALAAADRGTVITVTVTGTKAEYASVSTTSGGKRIR